MTPRATGGPRESSQVFCWILLAALAAPLDPGSAAAAGINLSWNDCVLNGGTSNLNDACDSDSGTPGTLVASVDPPYMTQCVGFVAALEFLTAGPLLDSWWHYEAGGCREGTLRASLDFAQGPSACPDPWNGLGEASVEYRSCTSQVPGSACVFVRGTRYAPTTLDPSVSSEWLVFKLEILRPGTTSCGGCLTGACLMLASVELIQPPGVGNYVISLPAFRQHVTWQSGTGQHCPPVDWETPCPAAAATWGTLKALYR